MAESWDDAAPAAQVAELPEIKLFGKWSSEDVQVSDISLTVSNTGKLFTIWGWIFGNPTSEKLDIVSELVKQKSTMNFLSFYELIYYLHSPHSIFLPFQMYSCIRSLFYLKMELFLRKKRL